MQSRRPNGTNLTRRGALGLLAVTATGGLFVPAAARAQSTPSGALLMPEAGVCTIMPQQTAGPFYFDPQLDREDITEGKPGAPLTVRLQVVDGDCTPIAGARVDLWHCDAQGHYSGYPGQGDGRDVDTSGEKFLRGNRITDSAGVATFRTIYPGWYRGRTTHIHFKVFPDQDSEMTGQFYFPDALSEFLFTSVAPYNERASVRDTMNADDRIARAAGDAANASLREVAKGYQAALIVAVDPNA